MSQGIYMGYVIGEGPTTTVYADCRALIRSGRTGLALAALREIEHRDKMTCEALARATNTDLDPLHTPGVDEYDRSIFDDS